MHVLVYVHRKQQEAALERVAALRAEGKKAQWRDVRGFDGDVEACEQVVTDDPQIASAHAARGIDVVPFTEEAPKPAARRKR